MMPNTHAHTRSDWARSDSYTRYLNCARHFKRKPLEKSAKNVCFPNPNTKKRRRATRVVFDSMERANTNTIKWQIHANKNCFWTKIDRKLTEVNANHSDMALQAMRVFNGIAFMKFEFYDFPILSSQKDLMIRRSTFNAATFFDV